MNGTLIRLLPQKRALLTKSLTIKEISIGRIIEFFFYFQCIENKGISMCYQNDTKRRIIKVYSFSENRRDR
ncbi:hypothetical protein BIY26_15950 [Brenneria goodwinii]|uniref:Uncharacterized protein n=1 Tax=Brenneria goodwinii TaxID=1109412 RepID=A0AAE8ELW5_9GAMM|nr:hypothetical protein AWC36_03350 [Brenneria goodwinii]RLM20339.1 hypothetical protein BIY26_15950 [Brenneria goodwinii]